MRSHDKDDDDGRRPTTTSTATLLVIVTRGMMPRDDKQGQQQHMDYYLSLRSHRELTSDGRHGFLAAPVPKFYFFEGFGLYSSKGLGAGRTPSPFCEFVKPKPV